MPDDGYVDPNALMQVLTWGAQGREDFGWLEMWVYMCSFGRQPKTNKYMTKNPDALKEFMADSVEKRRKQAVARNMMDLNKQAKALQDQIAAIASGKEEATKIVNADGSVSDNPAAKGKRFRKHHSSKSKKSKKHHHKQEKKDEHGYTETQKKQLIPLLKQWD